MYIGIDNISYNDEDGQPHSTEALVHLLVHRVNHILSYLSRPDVELQEPTHQTYARIVQLQADVAALKENQK